MRTLINDAVSTPDRPRLDVYQCGPTPEQAVLPLPEVPARSPVSALDQIASRCWMLFPTL